MDFLALYITLKISHTTISLKRMTGASLIGALWALVTTLIEPYTKTIPWQIFIMIGTVLLAGVMTSIATGSRTVSVVASVSYIAVSVGLGGVMTAIYGFVSRAIPPRALSRMNSAENLSPAIFAVAAIIAGVVSLIYEKMRENSLTRKKVSLTLFAYGKKASLELLCDSGNLLCDPISLKPVIIVSADSLCGILPPDLLIAASSPHKLADVSGGLLCGLRFIPIKSVTGQGILLCFRPEEILLDSKSIDALVAIDTNSSEYAGCDGIIPQILLSI